MRCLLLYESPSLSGVFCILDRAFSVFTSQLKVNFFQKSDFWGHFTLQGCLSPVLPEPPVLLGAMLQVLAFTGGFRLYRPDRPFTHV